MIEVVERLDKLLELVGRPDPVHFRRALVSPPSRVYIGRDDRVFLRSRNSLAGVALTLAGRFQHPDGQVVPVNFNHTPNTDRSAALISERFGEGYLLSALVFPSTGTPRRGQCFVELGILRGVEAAAAMVHILAADYVTASEALAFPGSIVRSSVDGPGMLRSITGTDPAANTEITEAVPTNARWAFHGAYFTLVTDANPANRRVFVTLSDGANVYLASVSASTQAASSTEYYSVGGHGVSSASVSGVHFVPLPDAIPMFQGWQIDTLTSNMQVGDNYSAPQITVEEWIEE